MVVTRNETYLKRFFEAEQPPAELVGLSEAELEECLTQRQQAVDEARQWSEQCRAALFTALRNAHGGHRFVGVGVDSVPQKVSRANVDQLRRVREALKAAEEREREAKIRRQAVAKYLRRVRFQAINRANMERHEREAAEREAQHMAAAEAVVRGLSVTAQEPRVMRWGRQVVRMAS